MANKSDIDNAKQQTREAGFKLIKHIVKSAEGTNATILQLQEQIANINLYIARTIFRREMGLPPEPLSEEELRGKGRKL